MNMKKVNLDTWIQLLGMLGVLGGLVFVGLEMRQSQQLALAAQQTARMQVWTDMVNAFTESQINYPGGNGDFKPEMNVAHAALWIFENDYIQFELGLMDENIWQAKMNPLRRTYNTCDGRDVYLQRKSSLDVRLVALIDSLLDEECVNEPLSASANE
tara:strand:+ start:53 stop:523 length:471 start_codon:yes stop_codon:yes gene_type:complete